VEKIHEIEIRVAESDEVGRRQMLERVGGTALNSKLISRHKRFFSPMVCSAMAVTLYPSVSRNAHEVAVFSSCRSWTRC